MFTIILLIAFIYVCYITYWSLLKDAALQYWDIVSGYFNKESYIEFKREWKQWSTSHKILNTLLLVTGPVLAIPLLLIVVIMDAHNYRRK